MADYAASVLAKGQTVVTAKYQTPEQRRKIPTVMELAIKNQKISIPNAQDLRVSPLRTVDVNFLTNIAAGSATAKVAAHTGTYGDSAKINVVYVTHVETMSLPRKLAYNNINSYQDLFNNLFEMKWKNLRTRQDTSALAFLLANRCQLDAAVINPQIAPAGFSDTSAIGSWDNTNFAGLIKVAEKARFIQWAKAFMAARHFTGAYDIVADLQMAAQFEYQLNQGQGNAANTSFQFGDAGIATTQDSVSSFYPQGSALVMPQGTLAGLVWNEGLNKAGVNAGQNSVGNLGTVADPLGSGAIADLSMYTARADTSANTTGGSTQDIVDQWELSLTIGYVTPPLSVASDSVIHLFGQSAT
jgi:hypothetical protein